MSGKGACAAIQDIRSRGESDRQWSDVANNFSPGGIFKAQNKSDNAIINTLSNNFESINQTIIDNKCQNITKIDQSNIYTSSPVCFTSSLEFCKYQDYKGTDKERSEAQRACLAELAKMRSAPVSQENINTTSQDCIINSAIQVISKQEGSIDNAATLESLQKSKSFMSENKGSNLNCSEISNNITSKQYITQLLKCHNETAITQNNTISDCNPNLTSQINRNNTVQNCLIKSGIISDNSQSAGIKNNSDLKSDQTADALGFLGGSKESLMMIAIILVIGVIAFAIFKFSGGGGSQQSVPSSTLNSTSNRT